MILKSIRHATMIIQYGNKKILIDPVFSKKGTKESIECLYNNHKNPLVDMDTSKEDIIQADAVMITHVHSDHFDQEAINFIPKDMLLFCQPEDFEKIESYGFKNLKPIENSMNWEGIDISRTSGQHGTGEIGKLMGKVSGFVFRKDKEESIYITGDTIWCEQVKQALEKYKPDIVVCYGGAAAFKEGGPITMTAEHIEAVLCTLPKAKVIIVHMEAWNHCQLKRQDLRDYLKVKSLLERAFIPYDGQEIQI